MTCFRVWVWVGCIFLGKRSLTKFDEEYYGDIRFTSLHLWTRYFVNSWSLVVFPLLHDIVTYVYPPFILFFWMLGDWKNWVRLKWILSFVLIMILQIICSALCFPSRTFSYNYSKIRRIKIRERRRNERGGWVRES